MFSNVNNASKVGFITLVRMLEDQGFNLVDCQQETRHLKSLGARSIKRSDFLKIVNQNKNEKTIPGNWNGIIDDPYKNVMKSKKL